MKILLVQTAFLGDIVLSTPVVGALRAVYPEATISILTTPEGAELFAQDPLVAECLVFDKRRGARTLRGMLALVQQIRSRHFDVVYSLHKSFRTGLLLALAGIPQRIGFAESWGSFLYHDTRLRVRHQHEVHRALSILGPELGEALSVHDSLRLFAQPWSACSAEVQNLELQRSPYLVVVPGSVWATKRWTAAGFAALVDRASREGQRVVLVGGPGERGLCESVRGDGPALNLAGKTTISELLTIIQHAASVVCNDSGALHIASAFRVPTVAIFCATSPSFGFGPWQNRAEVVEVQGLSCRPCARHGSHRCPTGTEACMQGVGVDAVWQAQQRVMGKS